MFSTYTVAPKLLPPYNNTLFYTCMYAKTQLVIQSRCQLRRFLLITRRIRWIATLTTVLRQIQTYANIGFWPPDSDGYIGKQMELYPVKHQLLFHIS